jgi:hypothetical protein
MLGFSNHNNSTPYQTQTIEATVKTSSNTFLLLCWNLRNQSLNPLQLLHFGFLLADDSQVALDPQVQQLQVPLLHLRIRITEMLVHETAHKLFLAPWSLAEAAQVIEARVLEVLGSYVCALVAIHARVAHFLAFRAVFSAFGKIDTTEKTREHGRKLVVRGFGMWRGWWGAL